MKSEFNFLLGSSIEPTGSGLAMRKLLVKGQKFDEDKHQAAVLFGLVRRNVY